ncbi:uncharacterized protein LOC122014840 isoform X2 [Zingiber officinale]|uniref:uncharacterized protein LOC122014840 isoform X1 n=1 Tax=Zingiber officinale TaxID=94328 RepID=UPI001C4D51AE|nr:uncharacterized protein LOC122014840 isoform X1 [Zingiber officinale]XP_042427223.1 uncharacterized protein LOC122014840 isoform X2 [Zingiber officinale]
METAAGLNRAIPASSSNSSRKEWRAMPDVPYRSNGGEELEHVDTTQSAERTIHEVQVGVGTYDAGFCSITIDNGDDMLQRKLQEITSLREQLQQMEIELARAIARSEMMELQNSFEVKLKERIDSNNNLKEQLHEREQHILELERKVEDKDRELRTMKIDSEAAWAKEDLLREQNKELASFRRELDNTEAERAQHLSQICDLQEHIQGKDSQILALQEQNQLAQETIHFKDEQLREAHSWISRVQEMDALHTSTNQSLQAELRERTEQFNQCWIGIQRQFVEMDRHHMQVIQQLQLELSEARESAGKYKDNQQVNPANSMDSSSYNANQINVKDDIKSNALLGFISDASVDGTTAYISTSNSSSKSEHGPGVPLLQSSLIGTNGFISPGQIAPVHSYVLNPSSVPVTTALTNSHIPKSHMDHYQSMPTIPNHQPLQKQLVLALSDVSQTPNQSKGSSNQTEHTLIGPDAHYSFNLHGEIQSVLPENLSSHSEKQVSIHSGNSSGEVQVLKSSVRQAPATQQPQGALDEHSHLDFAREYCPPEKKTETKTEHILPNGSQSQEEVLKSGQQCPIPGNAQTLLLSKTPLEPKLLDERSLLVCIVRAIPAGSDGKIRISTTLPNRLGKMLSPLHWHDYKKQYGKLDDFVARHPELFVIEGDFIHLRGGAQQIISATAAVAKVAAAASASASSAPYTSLLPSVAVTPVAQVNRQKMSQSVESKAVSSVPYADDTAVGNAGTQCDSCTHISTRQDVHPNDVRSNIVQGLSDLSIFNKLKNVQEVSGLPSEIKLGNSSVDSAVRNTSNHDSNILQNKGMGNGRRSFGGKQQGRFSGSGLNSRP